MKLRHIIGLTLLSLALVVPALLLVSKPAFAACTASFTRPAGTCNYNVSGNCAVDASSTETQDCASTEASTTNESNWVTGAFSITFQNASTLNIGRITISSGGSIIQASGTRTINVGGVGGSAPVWVVDADNDGWSANYNNTFTATAAGRRRRGLMRGSTADCNDNAHSTANSCYAYGQGYYQAYYYGYGQGYYYGYGQGYYYGYGQGYYYGYGQSTYYGYGQSWYYGYGQSTYYCFLKDTQILMADGTRKSIKDIRVGDQVVSFDTATGRKETERVEQVIIHAGIPGTYLTVNGTMQVTANHPVWLNGSWQPIGNAAIGDTLVNTEGAQVTITSIVASPAGVNDLYNLHLSGDNHNYFADGFLVHNK